MKTNPDQGPFRQFPEHYIETQRQEVIGGFVVFAAELAAQGHISDEQVFELETTASGQTAAETIELMGKLLIATGRCQPDYMSFE